MKLLTESLGMVRVIIKTYQESCKKENGQVMSDPEALFRGTIFLSKYSGQTGYDRAQALLDQINQDKAFSHTNDLITYLLKWGRDQQETSKLRQGIYQALRIIAGFEEKHIAAFSKKYVQNFEVPEDKARVEVIKLIDLAISGVYCASFILCFEQEFKDGLSKFPEEWNMILLRQGRALQPDYGKLMFDVLNAYIQKYQSQPELPKGIQNH